MTASTLTPTAIPEPDIFLINDDTTLSPLLEELSAFDYFAAHIDKVPRILGSQDRLSWSETNNLYSLEALMQDNEFSKYDGYGWVVLPHTLIVTIDLDDCFDDEGNPSDTAVKVVEAFPGAYVEYSPSRKGLHVWLKLDEPWEYGNKFRKTKHGFEIKSNMFVTITQNQFSDFGDTLETYSLESLKSWFETFTGEKLTVKEYDSDYLDSNKYLRPNKMTVAELTAFLCDPGKVGEEEAEFNRSIIIDGFLGDDPSETFYNFANKPAWPCPYDDVMLELELTTVLGEYALEKHGPEWMMRENVNAIIRRKGKYYGTERDNVGKVRIISGTGNGVDTASNAKSDDELLATLFKTAKQFSEETPAEVDWLWQGYFPAGAAVELTGPVKRSGKTTLITYACRAILDGRPFMNRQTKKTRIVYLTEQPEASWREALEAADLLDREDFHQMSWLDMKKVGLSWPEAARLARLKAKQVGAKLLVFDTFNRIAGVEGDKGQSAGHMEQYLAPALEAMADGVCVVFVRHDRKSGGEIGESGMGSTAVAGAMDVLLKLGRGDGNTPHNVRILTGLGRFRDTPESLTIELTDNGYIEHGTITTVTAKKAKQAILDLVPIGEKNVMRQTLLIKAVKEEIGCKETTVKDEITDLCKLGKLVKKELGGQGNPVGLYQPAA